MNEQQKKEYSDKLFRAFRNATVSYAEMLTGQHIPGRVRKKVESKEVEQKARKA